MPVKGNYVVFNKEYDAPDKRQFIFTKDSYKNEMIRIIEKSTDIDFVIPKFFKSYKEAFLYYYNKFSYATLCNKQSLEEEFRGAKYIYSTDASKQGDVGTYGFIETRFDSTEIVDLNVRSYVDNAYPNEEDRKINILEINALELALIDIEKKGYLDKGDVLLFLDDENIFETLKNNKNKDNYLGYMYNFLNEVTNKNKYKLMIRVVKSHSTIKHNLVVDDLVYNYTKCIQEGLKDKTEQKHLV